MGDATGMLNKVARSTAIGTPPLLALFYQMQIRRRAPSAPWLLPPHPALIPPPPVAPEAALAPFQPTHSMRIWQF